MIDLTPFLVVEALEQAEVLEDEPPNELARWRLLGVPEDRAVEVALSVSRVAFLLGAPQYFT